MLTIWLRHATSCARAGRRQECRRGTLRACATRLRPHASSHDQGLHSGGRMAYAGIVGFVQEEDRMRGISIVKIGLLGAAIAGGAFADLTIVNQSFETPVTSSFDYIAGNCASGGTCSITQDGWTWANTGPNNGGAGVSANGSGFTSGNNNAPDGSQVLFLQNQSSVSQNVSGFVSQTAYDVTFYVSQRQNFGDPNPIPLPQLTVSIGGKNVVSGLTPPTGPQYTLESFIFTNTSASSTQSLLIAQTLPTTDETLFFDDIKITALTPEPAYFGLLGAGIAGLVLARKRRAN